MTARNRSHTGVSGSNRRRLNGPHNYPPSSDGERFWRHVRKTGTCWLWIGADSRRYGSFRVGGRTVRAHRWSYLTYVGPIPAGLQVDHLCHVRACVRPDHLEPVTQSVNLLRRHARLREAS